MVSDPVTAEVIRSERNATILDSSGRLAALSVGIPQFMLPYMGGEWVDADVVDVSRLTPGSPAVTGPAVIELAFSSLVLRPGDVARAVDSGDVLVDLSR